MFKPRSAIILTLGCMALAASAGDAPSAPVADPTTGNVYALGASGHLLVLTREGKLLWERALAEDFGLATTRGGSQASLVIEGDLVIVGGITSGWGDQARVRQRFLAFDKRTGEAMWVSTPGDAAPALVQVTPTELLLKPGERVRFRARLFDNQGRLLREEEAPAWSLAGLSGVIDPKGQFTAAEGAAQAGSVKATVGTLSGEARVRVVPLLPWSFDFEGAVGVPAHWVDAAGKFVVRGEGAGKALVKLADDPLTQRARAFMGSSGLSNYTVEADVLSREQRGQMGDGGVVAQRYALVLLGSQQRLEIQPWPPEIARTASAPFVWKPDTWYHLKLRVESHPAGRVRAFAKAWAAGEGEPVKWTLEHEDPIGNRQGSPGLYAEAPVEVLFDNVKVAKNR
jgi:hypothetical protein